MVPRWRARSEKKEYEATHARAVQRRLGMAIIACIAVLVIAGGVIYILIRYPNGFIHKSASTPAAPAACRYYSKDVTVDIAGVDGAGCAAIMRPMVNEVRTGTWISTTLTNGTQYAVYRSGTRTARLYDMDGTDTTEAAKVAAWFRKHGWT